MSVEISEITQLVGAVGSVALLFVKNLRDRFKDKKLQEKAHNRRNRYEKKLDDVAHNLQEHIDTDKALYSLPVVLRAEAQDIIEKRIVGNLEMKNAIIQAVTLISEAAHRVIKDDFSEMSIKLLKSDLISNAKLVRKSLTDNNLPFENSVEIKKYFESVKKEAVYPAIKIYIKNIHGIKYLKNGNRLNEYKNISKDFVKSLIHKVLNLQK